MSEAEGEECGVWDEECGARRMGRGGQNAEDRMRNVKCEVCNAKCGAKVKRGTQNAKCGVRKAERRGSNKK